MLLQQGVCVQNAAYPRHRGPAHARSHAIIPRGVHTDRVQAAAVSTPEEPGTQRCPMRVAQQLPKPQLSLLEEFYLWWFEPREWLKRTFGSGPFTMGRLLGITPSVFVGSADVARELLSYEARGSVTAGWPLSFVSLIGSESVICVTDPVKHRYLRQLLAPALSSEAVAEYLDEIHAICRDTLEDMHNSKGTALSYPIVKSMTLKVIASVVLNLQLNHEEFKELAQDFATFLRNVLTVLPFDYWPFSFHESMNARRRIAARLQEQVSLVRSQLAAEAHASMHAAPVGRAAAGLSSRSTLRKLLTARDEQGNRLTDQQVVDNLVLMMFAGHDTSTVQLVSLLYELALKPEVRLSGTNNPARGRHVLARVREEQLHIMAMHGPRMTPAALKDMRYTQAVLSEVLRRRPPATGFVRQAKDDIEVQGHLIPANTPAVVSLLGTLSNDPRWPDQGSPEEHPLHPANFNPDRFLTEEGSKQGDQVPFGLGAHTCAGQALAQAEAKVFLATLARSYTLLADSNTYWIESSIPRPSNNLPVLLQRI